MSREWVYSKRRWVEVRYGPVDAPDTPASPQMSHGLALHS
jgi:hypothetical protein